MGEIKIYNGAESRPYSDPREYALACIQRLGFYITSQKWYSYFREPEHSNVAKYILTQIAKCVNISLIDLQKSKTIAKIEGFSNLYGKYPQHLNPAITPAAQFINIKVLLTAAIEFATRRQSKDLIRHVYELLGFEYVNKYSHMPVIEIASIANLQTHSPEMFSRINDLAKSLNCYIQVAQNYNSTPQIEAKLVPAAEDYLNKLRAAPNKSGQVSTALTAQVTPNTASTSNEGYLPPRERSMPIQLSNGRGEQASQKYMAHSYSASQI